MVVNKETKRTHSNMMVSEKLLILSIICMGVYLDLRAQALGRYVIEQKGAVKPSNKNASDELPSTRQRRILKHRFEGTNQQDDYSLSSSVSGHRVPVTGPRQLQKQQFDAKGFDVRIETVLIMSILGGAFVCIVVIQVWRQIHAFKKKRRQRNDGGTSQIVESIKNCETATGMVRSFTNGTEQFQFLSAETDPSRARQ